MDLTMIEKQQLVLEDGGIPQDVIINEIYPYIKNQLIRGKREGDHITCQWTNGWTLYQTFVDDAAHGKVIARDKNNVKKYEGNFKYGVKHGLEIDWLKSSPQLSTISYYLDGFLHGVQKTYYTNGTLASVHNYVYDKHHGKQTTYHPNGSVCKENNYHLNMLHGPQRTYRRGYGNTSRLIEIRHYKFGRQHGEYRRYMLGAAGDYEYGNYVDGKKHGKFCTLSNYSHCMKTIEHYKHGVLHGEEIITGYYNQYYRRRNYVDGELHGECIEWEKKHGPLIVMNYKHGALHGEWSSWTKKGVPIRIREFKDGQSYGEDKIYKYGKVVQTTKYTERKIEKYNANGNLTHTTYYTKKRKRILKEEEYEDSVCYKTVTFQPDGTKRISHIKNKRKKTDEILTEPIRKLGSKRRKKLDNRRGNNSKTKN